MMENYVFQRAAKPLFRVVVVLIAAITVCSATSQGRSIENTWDCTGAVRNKTLPGSTGIICSECNFTVVGKTDDLSNGKQQPQKLDGKALICEDDGKNPHSAAKAFTLDLTTLIDNRTYPLVVFENFPGVFLVWASNRANESNSDNLGCFQQTIQFSRMEGALFMNNIEGFVAPCLRVVITNSSYVTFPKRMVVKGIEMVNISGAQPLPIHLVPCVQQITADRSNLSIFGGTSRSPVPATAKSICGNRSQEHNVTIINSVISNLTLCCGGIRLNRLTFQNVSIRTISKGAFKNVSLDSLEVTDSRIGKIEKGSFDGLPLGTSFLFKKNQVEEVGEEVFRFMDTAAAAANGSKSRFLLSIVGNNFTDVRINSFDVQMSKSSAYSLDFADNDVKINCSCTAFDATKYVPRLPPTGIQRRPLTDFRCTNNSAIKHLPVERKAGDIREEMTLCSACGSFEQASFSRFCNASGERITCDFSNRVNVGVADGSKLSPPNVTQIVQQATWCGLQNITIKKASELLLDMGVLSRINEGKMTLTISEVHTVIIPELSKNPPCCEKIHLGDIKHLTIELGKLPNPVIQATAAPENAGKEGHTHGITNTSPRLHECTTLNQVLQRTSGNLTLKYTCGNLTCEKEYNGYLGNLRDFLNECLNPRQRNESTGADAQRAVNLTGEKLHSQVHSKSTEDGVNATQKEPPNSATLPTDTPTTTEMNITTPTDDGDLCESSTSDQTTKEQDGGGRVWTFHRLCEKTSVPTWNPLSFTEGTAREVHRSRPPGSYLSSQWPSSQR